MNKKYIIKKNEEIHNIIKIGKKLINKYFVIYKKDNTLSFNRFCVSVSKKYGNAVLRNKIKRQIKDILMKNTIKDNNDYVIIIRNELINLSYKDKDESLLNLLKGEIKWKRK